VPTEGKKPDRYEPMPGIFELPGWLWRRTPPLARAAVALALVGLVVVAIVIGPDIQESKLERERAERQQRLEARKAREARLRLEQRPRFVSGPAATSGVPARRRLVEAARASVLADARRRVAAGNLRGPVEDVDCEPFPRNVAGIGAEDSTDQRFGRYFCLAVTAEFDATEATSGGLLGHPYRVRVDFDSGRYALCKVAGRPAEGQLKRRLGVTVPAVCGGGP
jgi:hypothetical protein